jgi:Tfp pilus assembly protein PilX
MRLTSTLRAAHGFSMIPVLFVMLVASLLTGAAFAAVGSDIPFARASQDRKQSYAAAEAGLQYYWFQLSRDNDFWTKCTTVPDPAPGERAPINDRWNGTGADPRVWRPVTAGSEAKYTVELLPANGATGCDTRDPAASMLDKDSGMFRIRATGVSRDIRRSIVASFRRSSFLDYIYFTDYETFDPALYANVAWAQQHCVRPRAQRDRSCSEITFPSADRIHGPLHTNDDLLVCGSPEFGRDADDDVEISGPAPNGWTACAGGAAPRFIGTKLNPAPTLTMPASNDQLRDVATRDGKVYTGKTTIVLHDDLMDVTTYDSKGTPVTATNVAQPPNGVIYVQNGACSGIASPLKQVYNDPPGCAVVTLKGTYSRSLTIASQGDILVNGDVKRSGDVVLGLIANSFVRVYHPVTRTKSSCSNAAGSIADLTIQAAMLTLGHSFIADNYDCGKLGTLHVDGAIAQKFRGVVGTFSGSTIVSGYVKDYWYDDRLRYRNPPFFLDPVSAAWKAVRSNEQVPAT